MAITRLLNLVSKDMFKKNLAILAFLGTAAIIFTYMYSRYIMADSTRPFGITTFETLPQVAFINNTWVTLNQDRLKIINNSRKLIIFAYMRGGSSLVGDTFAHDPDAFYWYEPLDQFYSYHFGYRIYSIPLHITYYRNGSRRVPDQHETEALTGYMKNLLSCGTDALPPETMSHPFMNQYSATNHIVGCMKRTNSLDSCKAILPKYCSGENQFKRRTADAIVNKCAQRLERARTLNRTGVTPERSQKDKAFLQHEECMRKLKNALMKCKRKQYDNSKCSSKRLHFAKVLRANMESMEPLLQAMPDLHILHYFRDPRAIAMSVSNVPNLGFGAKPGGTNSALLTEASVLCAKMRQDIIIRKQLEQKYPGALSTATYEDLVFKPDEFARRVYSWLGFPSPPAEWRHTINSLMYAQDAEENAFNSKRQNAKKTLVKWRSKVRSSDLREMSHLCKSVLDELHYK